MSYRLNQRLAAVANEYQVCLTALRDVDREWTVRASDPAWRELSYGNVRETLARLEATYLIRLFSEFEGCLHWHLSVGRSYTRIPRTAEALINRVALREHIPDPLRLAAHDVRDYRNALVHAAASSAVILSFDEGRRALHRFLAVLPELL